MTVVRVVTPAFTAMGESPVWDVKSNRLYWVDVTEGVIFNATPDGADVRISVFPGHVTSLALRRDGGAIVSSGTGLYAFDLQAGEAELLFDSGHGTGFSFNDGKTDRQGRFITGMVDQALVSRAPSDHAGKPRPDTGLYRLDPDLSVTALGGGIGITNGPCFSPDGKRLYCNDSWARRIYVFDYHLVSGTPAHRHTFVEFEADGPRPDGATVDDEGCLWVAAFEGGEIRRYSPEGALDRRVPMPVLSPTSLTFGGSELDVLFVTSHGPAHVAGTVSDHRPLAGCVFAIHGLGAHGVPEELFSG